MLTAEMLCVGAEIVWILDGQGLVPMGRQNLVDLAGYFTCRGGEGKVWGEKVEFGPKKMWWFGS